MHVLTPSAEAEQPAASRPRRLRRILHPLAELHLLTAAALAAACVLGLGMLAWSEALPGVFYDDGIYVLLGKSLATGHGLHYLGVPGAPPAAKYPPLYPLLLALTWRMRPEVPAAFSAFELVNVVLAALGAGAFLYYLERTLRLPRAFAAAVALGAWLTADVWRYAVIPLSEPLFTLTFVLALAAGARLESDAGRARGAGNESRAGRFADALLFLGAFAAAYYTRTVGVVLAGGVVLALLSRRRLASAAAVAGGAVLIALPWLLWGRVAARAITPGMADLLGPYGDWLSAQLRHPVEFALSTARASLPFLRRLAATVLPSLPGAALALLGPLLALVAALGARDLWRRSRVSALTVAAFLGVLWLWPFGARRLLAPVAPWLILMVAAGFLALARGRRPALRRLAPLAGAIWAAWFVGASAVAFVRRDYEAPLVERTRELATAAQAVSRATPPDAVVGSAELWAGIHVLTGRAVAPSIRFHPVTSGEPLWGSAAEQHRLWREAGLRYLWVLPGNPVEGDALRAIAAACGPRSLALIASSRVGELVRLDWDESCRERLAPTQPRVPSARAGADRG